MAKPKTIWIINPYGRLPNEGWRDYRTTFMAKALTKVGHKVVWWISDFNHLSKTFRNSELDGKEFFPGFSVRLMPVTPYIKHISFARIRAERRFGKAFRKEALAIVGPDIILCGDPSIFFNGYVQEVHQHFGCKLMIDIMDLWPELFHLVLPKPIRSLGRLVFWPLYKRRENFLSKADAVTAVTHDYLDVANRAPCKIKRVVYIGVEFDQVRECIERCDPAALTTKLGLPVKGREVWVIYAGTLGPNYDMASILDCARYLKERIPGLRFLLAGDGVLKSYILDRIDREQLANVTFLGALTADDLTQVYALCDIALSVYVNGSTVSMPTKAFDYLAAGLPMVNSLGRELGMLVEKHQLGINYPPENLAAFISAIERLAHDPKLRQEMGANALSLAEQFDSMKQHSIFAEIVAELPASEHP